VNELLREIGERVAREAPESYFVGGCVRDWLRGEPLKDVDLVLRGDTHAVGKLLRKAYDGHVFFLREEDEVVRVLLPAAGLQIDLSPLKGTLEQDLLARDLTINAMAVAAASGLAPDAEVIDPTGGRRDRDRRLIRFVRPDAPVKDPLRTLRALRFRWKLDFTLAEGTGERIRECVPLLERVSSERIRDELFQLLALASAADALDEVLSLGAARWLTGAAAPEVDACARSGAPAARVRAVQALAPDLPHEAERLLQTELTPPRTRRAVLLWAAALQPLVPPLDPAAATRALALSSDERDVIVKGLGLAGEARELLRRWPQPGRVRRRFFERAGPAKVETVLLAAAEQGWSHAAAELLEEAIRRQLWPEPPLLSGVEVMQLLRLEPGPAVGRAIGELEDARADGLIRTPEEAAQWLRERLRRESEQEP
jgi:poly(A) polymerase